MSYGHVEHHVVLGGTFAECALYINRKKLHPRRTTAVYSARSAIHVLGLSGFTVHKTGRWKDLPAHVVTGILDDARDPQPNRFSGEPL